MTAVSSSPRGEASGRPGAAWETVLRRLEVVVPDDAPAPIPNRATRRALKRSKRKPI